MEKQTITLGEASLDISAVPLGRLKQLVPSFNRAGRAFILGTVDEAAMDDVVKVLAAGTGLTVAQIEAMPATFPQLMEAVDKIATVCGLKPKGPEKGEGNPGAAFPASTPGMPSTPD